MPHRSYSTQDLRHIIEQATIYQCACPAQICTSLQAAHALYGYQQQCLSETSTDVAVHQRISATAERLVEELEQCLEDVLRLEGWDMETLTMPADLQKRLLDNL
jgi:hypothetical protein